VLWIVYVDMKAAFDSVNRQALWLLLLSLACHKIWLIYSKPSTPSHWAAFALMDATDCITPGSGPLNSI